MGRDHVNGIWRERNLGACGRTDAEGQCQVECVMTGMSTSGEGRQCRRHRREEEERQTRLQEFRRREGERVGRPFPTLLSPPFPPTEPAFVSHGQDLGRSLAFPLQLLQTGGWKSRIHQTCVTVLRNGTGRSQLRREQLSIPALPSLTGIEQEVFPRTSSSFATVDPRREKEEKEAPLTNTTRLTVRRRTSPIKSTSSTTHRVSLLVGPSSLRSRGKKESSNDTCDRGKTDLQNTIRMRANFKSFPIGFPVQTLPSDFSFFCEGSVRSCFQTLFSTAAASNRSRMAVAGKDGSSSSSSSIVAGDEANKSEKR